MGLNSHLHTYNYVPMYHIVPLSLSHVDVRTRAHHLYTLRIPWCISSTLPFPYYLHIYTMCMCNVAHSTFAPFARFSSYGRKSSRHPPPPNRTSTGMCQRKGKNVGFSVKAGNRVLSILVACSASSSTSSKTIPSIRTTVASRPTIPAE